MRETAKLLYKNSFALNDKGCLFLDRDGVIIKDCHYIKEPNMVVLHSGAKELFQRCSILNLPIVIVTNQSGISRGILDWRDYSAITEKMLDLLDYPSSLVGIYANANSDQKPSEEDWRKPGGGMLQAASKDMGICINKSVMMGDRLSDLIAGANAGVQAVVHVLTGHGVKERQLVLRHMDKNRKLKTGKSQPRVILSESIQHAQDACLNIIDR